MFILKLLMTGKNKLDLNIILIKVNGLLSNISRQAKQLKNSPVN